MMPMISGRLIVNNLPLAFKVSIFYLSLHEIMKVVAISSTNEQYDQEVKTCRDIFVQKTPDYGTSWRVLRTISIADQLYIKARRIRTLQETRERKVGEDKAGEFRAMVNYGIIGLIQGAIGPEAVEELSVTEAGNWYDG